MLAAVLIQLTISQSVKAQDGPASLSSPVSVANPVVLTNTMADENPSIARPLGFPAGPPNEHFVGKTVSSGGYSIPYSVYVPVGFTPNKKWPVILFLAGSGQRGNDGWLPTQAGMGPSILAHPEWFPAIVVFPQCPDNLRWTSPMGPTAHAPIVQDLALLALEQAIRDYSGDARRVTLTGISLGGAGVWALGASQLNRFIALMPLCGRVDPSLAPKLIHQSIWVFHGSGDDTVPVEQSRTMVQALIKDGAKHVRYTEIPGAGHSIWETVYNEAEVISFLIP
jgi:predicted peptidase